MVSGIKKEQYVCLVCGFNMIGHRPDKCPFCGAGKEKFITSEECSAQYKVVSTPVNEKVTRLNSVPPLGLEHAAFRLETGAGDIWIDCPSSFDVGLAPVERIIFTHHHFLGASNLYREHFNARVLIHTRDSSHDICRRFTFDETFDSGFSDSSIEAFHIGGHTPGFTFYIFETTLLLCDYVFLDEGAMRFNPFGPKEETVRGGEAIRRVLSGREILDVCGFNYSLPFEEWLPGFEELLLH